MHAYEIACQWYLLVGISIQEDRLGNLVLGTGRGQEVGGYQ